MSTMTVQDTSLTAVADAIRAKTGSTQQLKFPSGMVDAIAGITTGGGGSGDPAADYVASRTDADGWYHTDVLFGSGLDEPWFSNYPRSLYLKSTKYLFHDQGSSHGGVGSYGFYEVNSNTGSSADISNQMYNVAEIRNGHSLFEGYGWAKIPAIEGTFVGYGHNDLGRYNVDIGNLFANSEITGEELADRFNMTFINTDWRKVSVSNLSHLFFSCEKLVLATPILTKLYNSIPAFNTTREHSPYYMMFNGCHSLRSVVVPVFYVQSDTTTTYTQFVQTFVGCHRLYDVTFAMENNQPVVRQWSHEHIDLTSVGYYSSASGDKVIDSLETYQQYRNDPEAVAKTAEWSQFDRSRALAFIRSLPDCSTGGNNTVKFNRNSGLSSTLNPISNLTDSELAIATNKGWTIAFS